MEAHQNSLGLCQNCNKLFHSNQKLVKKIYLSKISWFLFCKIHKNEKWIICKLFKRTIYAIKLHEYKASATQNKV